MTLRLVLYPFMVLAGLGFLASLVLHAVTIPEPAAPDGSVPLVLQWGVALVWIPAIVAAYRLRLVEPARPEDRQQRTFLWVLLAGTPHWMRVAVFALALYAAVNFLYSDGFPVRSFSTDLMLFYFTAFAALYSRVEQLQSAPSAGPS